jgi:hypothetical protein
MKDRTLTLLDTKEDMIANVAMTKNRMFLLNIEKDLPKCLNAYVKDKTCLWHVNFDSLKMMAQKKDVKGFTIHYTSKKRRTIKPHMSMTFIFLFLF